MQQEQLFHEDWRSALRHAVLAMGGVASVAVRLWPGKTPKQAEQKLANCLNPDHEWKLDLEEIETIMTWAREQGIHCAMHKLADTTGYTRPDIAPTKTPAQILADEMAATVAKFKHLADEYAAITKIDLRAVK